MQDSFAYLSNIDQRGLLRIKKEKTPIILKRKAVSYMEITVRDYERIIEIWLTNHEKANDKLKKSLQPIFGEYKQKKYKVAVFHSGERDLADSTAGLLLHNRIT